MKMKMKKNKRGFNELSRPQKVIFYSFMTLVFLIMFVPLWNVFVMSTSTPLGSTASGLKLWWDQFSLDGYRYVFETIKLGKPLMNSLYVTSVSVVFQVLLSAFAGYVLIQKDLPFKKTITTFIMFTMMIPGDLTLISIFELNKQLGLLNSYTGLIVNGLISGFSILLMRNYFLSVPYALAESARLDGASEVRIFGQIYLPLAKAGLATVFFLEFVAKWNSIMIPATIITDQSKFTLPLMLKALIFQDASQSGASLAPNNAVMATIIISTIPLLIIYVFAQRYLLSGMTVGATKE